MLLCRPQGTRILGIRSLCRRTTQRSYSNKVRAFPFGVSKEKAIADLSLNTALFTAEKVIGSWLRHLFPSLNIEALRPSRVQPAYLPTWIVDAEFEAVVWSRKQETDDHFVKDAAQVQFLHSDIPGFVYTPLSNLSLITPRLLNTRTIQWSDDLRRNEGDDVLCIPYSLTPFRLPEAARSLSMSAASIADVLRFEPPSIKDTMMAAYPVLIPIYLAQYDVKGLVNGEFKEVTISAFIEAAFPGGRSVVEVVPGVDEFFNMFNIPVPDLFIRGPHAQMARCFANVRSLLGNNVTLQHRSLVEQWVDRQMMSGHALRTYHDRYFRASDAARPFDWQDPRIRPFEPEERSANAQWLSSGADLFLLRSMLQVYHSKREGTEGQQQPDGTPTVSDRDVEWVEKQIEEMEKMREEKKPAWLAEYELQQRLLAPNPTPATPATSAKAEGSKP